MQPALALLPKGAGAHQGLSVRASVVTHLDGSPVADRNAHRKEDVVGCVHVKDVVRIIARVEGSLG